MAGHTKRCSKCDKIKIANTNNFGPDPKGSRGLRGDCRECRRKADADRKRRATVEEPLITPLQDDEWHNMKEAGTPKKAIGPKIVTLDIETEPIQSYHWGLWDQNVGLEQIQDEWTILSFSAKWLGNSKVIYGDTGGFGVENIRDDMGLLQALWNILDEADIVVAQNGKAFDIKKINARMLMAGFKPYSPVKVIDTMLVAKKHFKFTSNKLAWLSTHLTDAKKSEHKQFPGFSLWSECLKDNPQAWAEMKKYNCIDTVATEQLYLKLRPWIEGHTNVAAYNEMETIQCPKCGSEDVQMRGTARTQSGEYRRFQCQACGGWSRSRFTMFTATKKKSLLTN
jgi:predicted RNA-binding Zn-ribbon protein involved in translation (DUF1610 family)